MLPVASLREGLSFLGELLRPRWLRFAIVIVLHALAAVSALAVPYIIGRVIDALGAGTTHRFIAVAALAALGAYLAEGVLAKMVSVRTRLIGEEISAQVREDFIERVTHLPLSRIESAGTGDLLARTTNDISLVQTTIRDGVPRLLIGTVSTVTTYVLAFLVSPLLSLGLFITLPIVIIGARYYFRRSRHIYLWQTQSYSVLNTVAAETADFIGTVDGLDLGAARRDMMNRLVATHVFEGQHSGIRLRARYYCFLLGGTLLPTALVFAWGAYLAPLGHVSVGAIVTVALYANQVRFPIATIIMWLDSFQVAAVAFARIVGVRLVAPDREPTGATPAGTAMSARGVTYAYREGKDVLHGIDLDLIPGENLAIVGPSGAGKSTLGRMLAGIHPPTEGAVTVGGVRLVDLTEDELHSQVVLVTQEHHVFVGSLAYNLRLARPNATDEELSRALATVGATWVDDLPEGLATKVGSGAHKVSPGQAQQIALARLVLLDPHTVVLDEATSMLDPGASRQLEASLARALAGRTVVAIAHRLGTAAAADRVAVMEEGRITELGTHDDLVAKGGTYASLWATWNRQS